jgi:hypothetical protein
MKPAHLDMVSKITKSELATTDFRATIGVPEIAAK